MNTRAPASVFNLYVGDILVGKTSYIIHNALIEKTRILGNDSDVRPKSGEKYQFVGAIESLEGLAYDEMLMSSTFWLSTRLCPLLGFRSPSSSFSNVDLPDPDFPTIETFVPAAIWR